MPRPRENASTHSNSIEVYREDRILRIGLHIGNIRHRRNAKGFFQICRYTTKRAKYVAFLIRLREMGN